MAYKKKLIKIENDLKHKNIKIKINLFNKDFVFSIHILDTIKRYIKARKQNYKIIPLGTYCFPRIITTISGLKPRKDVGEKTCPFDLAFFNDINQINKLLKTNFQNFYNDLEFDIQNQRWVNKTIKAVFNHEKKISKQKFKTIYDKRIQNLYRYINNPHIHKFFIIATQHILSKESIINLKMTLDTLIINQKYDLIIINQSNEKLSLNIEKIHIIEQSHNFLKIKKMNDNNFWLEHIKELDTPEAIEIYTEIYRALKDIIHNV